MSLRLENLIDLDQMLTDTNDILLSLELWIILIDSVCYISFQISMQNVFLHMS